VKRLPGKAGAALAAGISVVALLAAGPAAAASSGAKVSITDSGFKPAVVHVKQWQVVTWTNDGKTKHGVASDTGRTLESGAFDPGQAYGNLFEKSGTFVYHDPAHPSFTGRVIVVAAPKPKVTGQTPPNGKKPKGFHAQATTSSVTAAVTLHRTRMSWTAAAIALGVATVGLSAVAAFLLLRRRRPA
jgi:plastocyanin